MGKRVLVIEDEVQTRTLFLNALEFEGFQAVGTGSGLAGIRLAQSYRPDLVVCDIMMPDLDGYGVLQALRKACETAAIPFIFLTAKVTMAELRRGMQEGADDYLTKPCTIEQFLGAIASRLKRTQELQQAPMVEAVPQSEADVTEQGSDATNIFPHCPHLQSVFEFIEAHYDQAINLTDVAKVAGYSPAYLTNLMQHQTGRTIKQWIIERRMTQARQLLKETANSVKHIAIAAGYGDSGYFSRQFRQLHGVSPQVWRDSVRS